MIRQKYTIFRIFANELDFFFIMKPIKHTIYAIFAMLLLAVAANAQNSFNPWNRLATSPKYETRAVWIGTIGGIDWPRIKATSAKNIERQKQELIDMLDALERANINTVLLQTRVRGSVIYPSDIEPWDDGLTGYCGRDPGYDPLAFAIEECHKRGMEIHAWMVTIPVGTSSKQSRLGSKAVSNTHPELCKTVKGEVFMIPGKPGTADYVASLCKELVEKYDIDGISLDYIRYPEKEYGFTDDNLYSDTSIPKADWKRANITRIVKAVYDAVKPIKPWVKLSSSPLGRYNNLPRYSASGWDCYNTGYQDPKLWLKEGWQDELFPMMYYQGNFFYPFVFNWKEISSGHPVSAGLGIYFLDPKEGKNWSLNDIRAQMHAARNSQMGGICFYRAWYFVKNFKNLYPTACNEFYSHPSLPQPMTWMGEAELPPAPEVAMRQGQYMTWSTYDDKDYYYNVYASFTSPVDITKGENLIAARVKDYYINMPDTTLFYAVTTMNRFGIESPACQEFPDIQHGGAVMSDEIKSAIQRHYSQPATNTKGKKKKKR